MNLKFDKKLFEKKTKVKTETRFFKLPYHLSWIHDGGQTHNLSQRKRIRCLWVFFLWFIHLYHKSLFDSCYLYCLTHVINSVSNDFVILIWYMLGFSLTYVCDIFSLSIVKCFQRNIPWMSWIKNLMRNLVHLKVH